MLFQPRPHQGTQPGAWSGARPYGQPFAASDIPDGDPVTVGGMVGLPRLEFRECGKLEIISVSSEKRLHTFFILASSQTNFRRSRSTRNALKCSRVHVIKQIDTFLSERVSMCVGVCVCVWGGHAPAAPARFVHIVV